MARPRARAALVTAALFAILVGLGVWQLQRLAGKEVLLGAIAAAERRPPVPLGLAVPPHFARVTASGVFRPATALYGAEVRTRGRTTALGAQLLQILDRDGLPPLLVDRGWVPTEAGAPVPAAGPATVTGYVRPAEHPGWLAAPDDPAGRRFYTLDPAAIAAALHAGDAEPYTLVVMSGGPAGAPPIPAEALPRPVNNHLNYALTWFGLAGALLAVFFAWAFGRPAPAPG